MYDLLNYIEENFERGEPIFLEEIPELNENLKRLKMKKLVDEGKLSRLYNGVYFRKYTDSFGGEGGVCFEKFIDKRYIRRNKKVTGYITGLGLVNKAGLTTQLPSVIEVASNEATTGQRKIEVDGRKAIIYKPFSEVNEGNVSAVQFLSLIFYAPKYAEIRGEAAAKMIKGFAEESKVDFEQVREYISFCPAIVYKNIYEWWIAYDLLRKL